MTIGIDQTLDPVMMAKLTAQMPTLHAAIHAQVPIVGVSVGDPANKATWRIDFATPPSAALLAKAQTVLNGFTFTLT